MLQLMDCDPFADTNRVLLTGSILPDLYRTEVDVFDQESRSDGDYFGQFILHIPSVSPLTPLQKRTYFSYTFRI